MFLVAKTASAATAALGFAQCLVIGMVDVPLTALAAVILFTLIVLGGIQRSNLANIAVVTLLSLGFFVMQGCL